MRRVPFPEYGTTVYFLGIYGVSWCGRAELDLTAQGRGRGQIEQWHVTAAGWRIDAVFPFENFYWRYTEALSGDWSSGVRWRPPTPCTPLYDGREALEG